MRDPAGREYTGRGRRQISWVLRRRRVQQVAQVIQGHDDHDQAAGEIDGLDAGRKVFSHNRKD